MTAWLRSISCSDITCCEPVVRACNSGGLSSSGFARFGDADRTPRWVCNWLFRLDTCKRFCLASIERVKDAIGFPADKDSEPRQRRAIERFAKSAGYEIVDRFNDPAVSGADPIVRPSSSRLTISIVRFSSWHVMMRRSEGS
jgi:hypothetical protein